MAITRLNAFHAKPGRGAALRRFLASVITDVRAAPGCRSCELYEALDDPEHVAVVEVWETVEAHKAAGKAIAPARLERSEEHTSELQSLAYLVCRLLLEKKKTEKHVVY